MSEEQNSQRSKRKFSREEKDNYCAAWEESEVSRIDFCKAHGISRSALYQWTKGYKKEDNDSKFSSLTMRNDDSVTDTIPFTIAFSNNPLQLRLSMPKHRLISFIWEISDANAVVW